MTVSTSPMERLFNLLALIEEPEVGEKVRELALLLGSYFPEGNEADEEGISYRDMLCVVNLAGCTRQEALEFNSLVKEAGGLDRNQAAYLIRVLGRCKDTAW
jgi:hypothetical protein